MRPGKGISVHTSSSLHGMALSSAQAAMIRKKPWKGKDHYEILHRESLGSDLPFPLVVPLRMRLVSDSARSSRYPGISLEMLLKLVRIFGHAVIHSTISASSFVGVDLHRTKASN
ncbi:hypothetical protein AAC387_Pa02g2595 [Persea americana]